MVERDIRLSVKIAAEERAMLQALADRDGISVSDYVRLFIRREYAEMRPAAKPGGKPRR